jgi:hypothetical protein
MVEPQTNVASRLRSVFDGFPDRLLPAQSFERLSRYYLNFDAFGRVERETDDPLVDEHTFDGMLREFVDQPCAGRVVRHLNELPGCAFRSAHKVGPPADEVSWFDLTKRIVVFDGSPSATFRELRLPSQPNGRDLVAAVHERFGSMEEELVTPELIPSRIEYLLADDDALKSVFRTIERQLGWWSALAAALLIPPAVVARSTGNAHDPVPVANAWPLSMYLLAAALGGWTLTVVGSCILSPVK